MMIVLASIGRTQARVHVVGDRLRQSAVGYSALKKEYVQYKYIYPNNEQIKESRQQIVVARNI